MNLVLVHGFLGFRQIAGIEYFNGVKQYLEANGPLKILATKVDPDQGIAVRGGQLRRQILVALGDLPPATDDEKAVTNSLDSSQKTHIIGHSMGGLDSRFILSPANPNHIASRIASLTTISTPHRGSPIADLIIAKIGGQRLWLWNWWMERKLHQIVTGIGVSLDGLHDLTAGGAANFNRIYVDHPQVRYFSVAGVGRTVGRPTAKILYPAYKYIKGKKREDNDGLVAVASAKWREFDARLWPADHADEIGHDLDRLGKSGRFDHLARFGELVERLKQI
ncbi:MAG: esterase/lipase family protein [bacterium]